MLDISAKSSHIALINSIKSILTNQKSYEMVIGKKTKADLTLIASLNSIDEIIIVTDNFGKIEYSNHKAHQFPFQQTDYTTYSNLMDLLKKLNQDYAPDNCNDLLDLAARVYQSPSFISEKIKINLHKKLDKFYQVYTSTIYDDQLGHLGRIWLFEDISESQELDKLKSEFISIASHQLRTPLTSINGYLSLIKDGDFGVVSPELMEALQIIQTATNQMHDLVEDLLKVNSLANKQIINNIFVFNLNDLIIEVADELNSLAQLKNIILTLDLASEIFVSSDKHKLKECISNLIHNSIKYSHNNQIVTVKLSKESRTVYIKVEDHGIGIPFEQQSKIFEKFYRADNAKKQLVEGTGLGLYYVKEVIESLGGKITFISEENQGSIFTLSLPNNYDRIS